ncbi:MAG: hypothetical protein JSV16_11925, partial [Candidatus Hydrogenedentota bacterium]
AEEAVEAPVITETVEMSGATGEPPAFDTQIAEEASEELVVVIVEADQEQEISAAASDPEVIEDTPVEGEEPPVMLAGGSQEVEAEHGAVAVDTSEAVQADEWDNVIEQADMEKEHRTFEKMLSGTVDMMEDATPAEMATSAAPMKSETDVFRTPAAEDHITLTFRDADLNAVLDILARKGRLNILAGSDVKGVVTVRLVDVPLDVALNSILNVNGYGYVKTNNIVRILPLSQIGGEVETVTETYTLSYAQAGQAKATLASFLTSNGGIETDERTNMLIITDVPGNMERIRKLIPKIDRRVQQVLIEVLIVDSVLRDDGDLGIQWTLLNTESGSLDADGNPDSINITLPIANNAISLSFGALFGDFRLTAFIEALVNNTNSRILANPKVLTLNNQAATIEIVQEFPFNDVTQTSSGGQLSNITFKEIGTKLDVNPQITHDEHIILHIKPEQNFLAGETITGVPILDTRRAETTLIVKNHQTVVLGGLRLNTRIKRVTKVPFLGDLPGVKYAFRSVSSDKEDSELLVFLTVHIVESPPLLPEQKVKFDELANLPRKPGSAIELIR